MSFSFRALARSVPKGFSSTTFAPSASPALLIISTTAAAADGGTLR